MKKVLLATVALAALATAPALAADLRQPVYKAAPPAPVYVFNWTGCYVGGNVGGLWVNKDFTLLPSFGPGNPFFGQSFSANASSVAGGLQAGCNYQFAGGWVVGIQGDYDWTDAHQDRNSIFFGNFTDSFSVKSVASVTGRIGYAWDRFLGYVKGGGAWERDDYDRVLLGTNILVGSASETRGGWTIGVGGEYAFTNYLSGFVEYNYYDFGNRTLTFLDPAGGFNDNINIRERKSVLRGGLN